MCHSQIPYISYENIDRQEKVSKLTKRFFRERRYLDTATKYTGTTRVGGREPSTTDRPGTSGDSKYDQASVADVEVNASLGVPSSNKMGFPGASQ
jgi:hypothetical protein